MSLITPPPENILHLETKRLVLEPILATHTQELCDLFSDSALHQFVPFEVPTFEEQLERCKRWEKRVSPNGDETWLNWAARLKDNATIVGHFQAGIKADHTASIGYVVSRSFQNIGLATEALSTVFGFLRETMKVREVKAWSDTRNEASHRLAKKMGMIQVEVLKDADFFKGSKSDEFVFSKTFNKVLIARPSINLFTSFCEFVDEMKLSNQPLWDPYLPNEGESPRDFVDRLYRRETNPESQFAHETIYWGIVDGHVVGRISLRHILKGNLSKVGGHIGFEVRPSYRRQGIATAMLKELLATSKAKEIGELLLTCAPNNIASNQVIQAGGGVFREKIFVDFIGEDRNHYWINLRGRT